MTQTQAWVYGKLFRRIGVHPIKDALTISHATTRMGETIHRIKIGLITRTTREDPTQTLSLTTMEGITASHTTRIIAVTMVPLKDMVHLLQEQDLCNLLQELDLINILQEQDLINLLSELHYQVHLMAMGLHLSLVHIFHLFHSIVQDSGQIFGVIITNFIQALYFSTLLIRI